MIYAQLLRFVLDDIESSLKTSFGHISSNKLFIYVKKIMEEFISSESKLFYKEKYHNNDLSIKFRLYKDSSMMLNIHSNGLKKYS